MKLLPTLLVLALLPHSAFAQASSTERIFDIVPPAGRDVSLVDGYTVLRQPGTKFGAVLTFMPESGTTAWIPVAVLNTSDGDLRVGTSGVSARYGDSALKVWSTTGLIRLAKEGGISVPAGAAEGVEAGGASGRTGQGAPGVVTPDTIGPMQPGQQSQQMGGMGSKMSRNNEQERAHDLAVSQVAALRERLFRNEDIAPREIGRGDVRIDLPPPRPEGVPAEFVLTLSFGGETMDVLYRERVQSADD